MDIAKAFTFVTEDEDWVTKIGLGALVALASIFIIPIPLLMGYQVAVTRNVMNGEERPLPKWDDLGKLFSDGLALIIAQLVYTLPFWGIACIMAVSTIGLGGFSEAVSEEVLVTSLFATWGGTMCLGLLFMVAYFFLSPAIVIQYVRNDGNLGSCFRFAEVFAIARDNMGDIVLVALAAMGANLVLSVVLAGLNIIPCLGQIVSIALGLAGGPWLMALMGHLYGQIAAKGGKNPNSDFDTDDLGWS